MSYANAVHYEQGQRRASFHRLIGDTARDLLHHNGLVNGLSDSRTRLLKAATDAAALNAGHVRGYALRHLVDAVEQAESVVGTATDPKRLAAVRQARAGIARVAPHIKRL